MKIAKIKTPQDKKIKRFSDKVVNSIKGTGYLTVWEGSVRSAKTVASLWAWIFYIANSPEKVFLMSGKTQSTIYRNCIGGEYGLLALTGHRAKIVTHESGVKAILFMDKIIFYVGANDKQAFTKIRGMTIGGWYADEVNLQPKSFIEEAFRRSIVSEDRKNFWTLNPETPHHWIYTDYIDRYRDENLAGYNWYHFTLQDNPAITKERRKELEAQYTGVFYQRYILGKRVKAEGLVYECFDYEKNTVEEMDINKLEDYYISADYGTRNPMTWGLWGFDKQEGIWYKVADYYWDSGAEGRQKTDDEYADDLESFVQALGIELPERYKDKKPEEQLDYLKGLIKIIVDPSANSFIVLLKQRGWLVIPAENDVMDGIRVMSRELNAGRVKYKLDLDLHEFQSYVWSDKEGEEKPIKEDDHIMDSDRYFVYTVVEKGKGGSWFY